MILSDKCVVLLLGNSAGLSDDFAHGWREADFVWWRLLNREFDNLLCQTTLNEFRSGTGCVRLQNSVSEVQRTVVLQLPHLCRGYFETALPVIGHLH